MENTASGRPPVKSDLKAVPALQRYALSVRFPGNSKPNFRLDIFDGIKKLGLFSIQNERNHLYSLDFRTELTKDGLEEKLRELAGPAKLFEFTITEV